MKKYTPAFMLLFFFAFQNKTVAQTGSLDPTFGVNGRFMLHQKFNYEVAQDIAITNEGKILVLEYTCDGYFLVRFLANGNLDSSFGDEGKALILDYDPVAANSISVDDSNRILVLAEDNMYGLHDTHLNRFLPDGTEDVSFNEINISGDADNSFLIQSDGKIVIAVSTDSYFSVITRITRWKENGLPDSTFTTAELNSDFSFPLGIAEQNDNKLLITGTSDSNVFVMRLMPDGLPDYDFGVSGTAFIDDGGDEAGQDVAVMSDGKIYITGYSETPTGSSFNCWRLSANGETDTTFGTNGLVTLHTGKQHNRGSFLFTNEDSTVIVGGSVYNGATNDPVLYKLLDNGSIDAGYGSNGEAGKTFTCSKSIELNAVKISDETIFVCGTKVDNGNILPAISKFSAGGITDTVFGINGTVSVALEDSEVVTDDERIDDFALLPDGRILAGGVANNVTLFRFSPDGAQDLAYGENGLLFQDAQAQYSNMISAYNDNSTYLIERFQHLIYGYQTFFIIDGLEGDWDFAVHKFAVDGLPDSSFGVNGILIPEVNGLTNMICSGAFVTQDSKLLIVGQNDLNFDTQYFLLQLNSDGSIDSSFANNGLLTWDFASWGSGPFTAIDPEGRIVIEASYYTPLNQKVFDVHRYLGDGTADISFGNNGEELISFASEWYEANGMAVTPGSEILSMIFNSNNGKNEILKLKENGSIDSSFGTNGYKYIAPIDYLFHPVFTVQPDNKILCLGNSLTILRLKSDGTLDSTFGTNGVSMFDTLPGSEVHSLHLQSDGKIVVSGMGPYDYYMARLLNDVQTGIENNPVRMKLQIFPNPCMDELAIQFPFTTKQATTITICDVADKKIRSERIIADGNQIMMNVQSLPAGLYLLTLKTHDQSSTVKFVKE